MKSEIVNVKETKEIDWSKPQVLISDIGVVVLYNGTHGEDVFKGSCISIGESTNTVGVIHDDWNKRAFKTITEPITIKFENE